MPVTLFLDKPWERAKYVFDIFIWSQILALEMNSQQNIMKIYAYLQKLFMPKTLRTLHLNVVKINDYSETLSQ